MLAKSKKFLFTSVMSAAVFSMTAMPTLAADAKADTKKDDKADAKVEKTADDAEKAEVKEEVKPQEGDIVVLYTNDIHCGIEEKDSMGITGVAAYKADMKKAYGEDQVTLVDCGDAIQGSAIGTLSKGSYMVDIMNAVGYDYAIFGNHEFDYTIPELKKLVEKAEAKYLGCNFKYTGKDAKADKLETAPYDIKDYNGVKVAYVGISTPETLVKSTPTYFMDKDGKFVYTFSEGNEGKDLYKAVQTAVDAARKEGAQYVVALAHLGVEETSAPYRSTDVIANTTGIDVMLDGHSHSTVESEEVKNAKGETVVLSQTGTKLAALGQLVISKDGKFTTKLVTDYKEKDEATSKVVAKINKDLEGVLNEVVAKADVELSTDIDGVRAVRNQETALGDLCADAYRNVSGADIAFVNGGGIRATIAKGDVTYQNIIAVHPYGNELCVVEATGQEILDALELGSRSVKTETTETSEDGKLNAAGENGGFLQVAGLQYTIDTSIPSTVKLDDKKMFVEVTGERRVKDVKVLNKETGKYEAIKADKTYTLASHNYMLKSMGDGYTMFADNKYLQDSVMLDNQVLITYIKDQLKGVIGEEYAKPQGRITIERAAAKEEVKADTKEATKEAAKTTEKKAA